MNDLPNNNSALFPSVTTTEPSKPLTRKAMREKTGKERFVESTRIGIPIAAIAVLMCSAVGFLYTNVMSAIATLSGQFEIFRKDGSVDHDKLIRIETFRETDKQAAESRIQMLDAKVQTLADQLSKKR